MNWFMNLFSRYDCDWYCDECGAYLNSQLGFTADDDEWVCTECGMLNDVTEDNIIGNDDFDEIDDLDDIPEGCRACGGNYPLCCDSCPLFDD